MVPARCLFAISFLLGLSGFVSAQQSTTTCTLEDGRQVYIRYNSATTKSDKPSNGKPWTPGGSPMTLFTEAPLSFSGAEIPLGAYTVYPFPAKDRWSLAVNKNVTPGSPYDEKQDIARGQIETDQIPQPAESLEVAFAHVGNKCTLRIVFGKYASFADFMAK
ncbi:MAG TPA: DUF2911 domain-containing protein [Candidatus Binatia bacterium]|nr:DUF2911 domain-containing protein [Candidatus Binatia bacterium]